MLNNIIMRMKGDIKKNSWVIVGLAIYFVAAHLLLPVACPLIYLSGFPCAGCGMTRAVVFVITGQFARAFYLNPLAFFIVLFGGYCFYCRYIKGKAVKGFHTGIIIFFVLLFVIYGIRMFLFFPDRVPYVYTAHNIMERGIPGYRELADKICNYFTVYLN